MPGVAFTGAGGGPAASRATSAAVTPAAAAVVNDTLPLLSLLVPRPVLLLQLLPLGMVVGSLGAPDHTAPPIPSANACLKQRCGCYTLCSSRYVPLTPSWVAYLW